MARKSQQIDNIFSVSPRDFFITEALNAQNSLYRIPNPYVGNKRKILVDLSLALYDTINLSEVNKVCDLFAGSSVVSAFFRMIGKKVNSNDLLASSYLNGVSLLAGIESPFSKEEWAFLVKNENKNKTSFVENKYVNVRFTEKECLFMDNFRANCKDLFGEPVNLDGTKGITDDSKFTKAAIAYTSIIHFIMTHCFVGGRLNSGQVIATLKHRLEHERNQNLEMAFNKMKPFSFGYDGPVGKCSHGDAVDFLKTSNDFDLVYIDPPYGGQQSDYAFMYQFFEEYIVQSNYEDIKYLQDHSKKFTKSKTYKDSFSELLLNLPSNAKWAISYNDSSWADIKTVTEVVNQYKKNIEIKEIKYSYNYRSAENTEGTEYLVVAW